MVKVAWVVRPAEGGILVHLDHLLQGLSTDFNILIFGPEEIRDWVKDHPFYPINILDGLHGKEDIGAIWQLSRSLRKEKPKLIHMHGLKSVVVGVPAARLSGCKRLLFTAHNSLPKYGICWHQLSQQFVQQRMLQTLPRIISVSDALRDELVQFVPAHRVTTIRNGVICEKFSGYSRADARATANIPAPNIAMGVVARLIPEKGVTTLLEAVSLVRNVNKQITLVVVGDGPARDQFEHYCKALDLNPYVRFLGHRSDVPFLMAGWDLFVLPSLSEGLSVSVLEAMASRLPVIVSDLACMREMVTHGKSGYLVKPKDAPGLAAAILHIIKDLPKARAMGEYNYQRVKNTFGTNKMVESTRHLYKDLTTREDLW